MPYSSKLVDGEMGTGSFASLSSRVARVIGLGYRVTWHCKEPIWWEYRSQEKQTNSSSPEHIMARSEELVSEPEKSKRRIEEDQLKQGYRWAGGSHGDDLVRELEWSEFIVRRGRMGRFGPELSIIPEGTEDDDSVSVRPNAIDILPLYVAWQERLVEKQDGSNRMIAKSSDSRLGRIEKDGWKEERNVLVQQLSKLQEWQNDLAIQIREHMGLDFRKFYIDTMEKYAEEQFRKNKSKLEQVSCKMEQQVDDTKKLLEKVGALYDALKLRGGENTDEIYAQIGQLQRQLYVLHEALAQVPSAQHCLIVDHSKRYTLFKEARTCNDAVRKVSTEKSLGAERHRCLMRTVVKDRAIAVQNTQVQQKGIKNNLEHCRGLIHFWQQAAVVDEGLDSSQNELQLLLEGVGCEMSSNGA